MSTDRTDRGPASPHAAEPTEGPLTGEELRLAFRNHGLPLEGLRYDITPTGMHYLVVHWDVPHLDVSSWRLRLDGCVRSRLELSLDDLRALPPRTLPVTLECAGNGRGWMRPRPLSLPWLGDAVGTAEWTGVPLGALLERAGIASEAVEVVFHGADQGLQGGQRHGYARSLPVAVARSPEVLLAYAMNGRPLEPQHGFPLRLVVPGWYGMASVKWLTAIEAVSSPFDGFQQAVAYRYQSAPDDPGERVDRMRVRALMVPPGVPDFFSRRRFVEPGPVTLTGRAWSGGERVERVEVAIDGRWEDARLGPPLGDFAWRGWTLKWAARVGDHELACRATDAAGNVQAWEGGWNVQGMGNNAVQRVSVTVR